MSSKEQTSWQLNVAKTTVYVTTAVIGHSLMYKFQNNNNSWQFATSTSHLGMLEQTCHRLNTFPSSNQQLHNWDKEQQNNATENNTKNNTSCLQELYDTLWKQ